MRKAKSGSFGLRSLVAAFAVMGFILAPAAGFGADEVYKGRLSYHWFPQHHSAKMSDLFVAECKKATNGRLDIEIFPSGQLFKIRQIVSALSQGSVDLGGVIDINFIPVNKNFQAAAMQRFFDGFRQKRDFWEKSPAGKAEWEGVQKKTRHQDHLLHPGGPRVLLFDQAPTGFGRSLQGAQGPLPDGHRKGVL